MMRWNILSNTLEESYKAGSRTKEAGVCRPFKQVGISNIRKETNRGFLIKTFEIVAGREKVKLTDVFECNKSNYNLRGHSSR